MACSARMISVVSPSVSLSVASSSSSSSAFASASVTLPRGSNGLSKSLPTRLVASGSNSLFLKRKLILHSSTNFGEAKRSVISAGRIRLEMVIASMLGTSLASGTHFPAYENLYSPLHVQSSDLPLVGNIAPNFEAEAVLDQEFVKIKLSDYIGKKYVVVFFYPLDFTFVCPTEITAFSDKYPEFEQLNTEVIGVSTDSVFSHLAWIQTDRKSGGLGELKYPLVSDLTKKISKAFNVLIVDQKPKEPMPGDIPLVGGIPKPVVQTEPTKSLDRTKQRRAGHPNVFDVVDPVVEGHGTCQILAIALRGLFIIDKEGIIQHATINNLSIGRSVEETLRTLQAVQYVQENPDEVCPVEWKPGEKTMKHDSKLSKEYFAAI